MKRMMWGGLALSLVLMAGCASELRNQELAGKQRQDRDELSRERLEASRVLVVGDPVASAPAALPAPMPTAIPGAPPPPPQLVAVAGFDTRHADHKANPWEQALQVPVSTFSIDVDTGSYTLARRMLREGLIPPREAVRTEEFLNYFEHGYAPPRSIDPPFSISTSLAPAPWNPERVLMQIGLQGFQVDQRDLPPANLVFLIDTSGSMHSADKLPLLRQGFASLVEQLRAEDRVAIVAYAGSAGLVLPSTAGDRKGIILAALDQLQAGGSTHGSAGIALAYEVAARSQVKGGINRVILATDGDFNVGATSVEALKALVAERREAGIALTTLGFGAHGYNDQIAEQLADVGNGHHAYIDDALEARRVLVSEMGGTLLTIAKDVKVQVEFNAQAVARYRLVGYENRLLAREDFHDDRVDAGEIGAGHDVTALYELELRDGMPADATLAALRLRYKQPDQAHSRLIEQVVKRQDVKALPDQRLAFAAAVAGFAEKLRGNQDLAAFGFDQLAQLLDSAGLDKRNVDAAELRDLIELAGAAQVSAP